MEEEKKPLVWGESRWDDGSVWGPEKEEVSEVVEVTAHN